MNYLLDFKNDVTTNQISEYLTNNNCVVVREYNSFDKTFLVQASVEPPVTGIIERLVIDSLSKLQLLDYATIPVNTQSVDDWWKVASIKSPEYDNPVETHILRGQNTQVYLMDSGIDLTHSEFTDSDIGLLHSFNGNFADNNGHGTALASLIVGKTCGLTNATLNVVKIFDSTVPTLQSDIVGALDIIAVHAASHNQPSVVNMSWNIAHNEFIDNKITSMIGNGIFVVAASGNDGASIDDRTPASNPLVLTIGAYNDSLMPCDFTNYDNSSISLTNGATNFGRLDGWAPGSNIRVATANNTFGMAGGTSVAAAIHTGAMLYNMSLNTLSDGTSYVNVEKNRALVGSSYSLSRIGLLTLTGNYVGAVNKISTYFTHSGDLVSSVGYHGIAQVGKSFNLPFATILNGNVFVPSIELPSGLRIDSGCITGIPLDIDVTAKVLEFHITSTHDDGSTKITYIVLGVIKSEVDLATAQPGTDPALDIILALPACCEKLAQYNCYNGSNCQALMNSICGDPYIDPEKEPQTCVCYENGDAGFTDICL